MEEIKNKTTIKNEIEEIKKLVLQNKSDEALMKLHNLSKNNQQLEITILTLLAEFNELRVHKNRGIINSNEVGIKQNKINVKILELINSIELDSKLNLKYNDTKTKSTNIVNSPTIILFVLTILFSSAFLWQLVLAPQEELTEFTFFIGKAGYYGAIICFFGLVLTLVINGVKSR